MEWLIGLITVTSPLWCQFLAFKYPHWTESENGISSVAIYGFLMVGLAVYFGYTASESSYAKDFRQYCQEKANDVYLCDFRGRQSEDGGADIGRQRWR